MNQVTAVKLSHGTCKHRILNQSNHSAKTVKLQNLSRWMHLQRDLCLWPPSHYPAVIYSLLLFAVSFLKKKKNVITVYFLDSFSSPADLQVGRGLRRAQLPPLLGRWAAASPARRPRLPWLLQSSPPSTPLETLQLPSPARSVCVSVRGALFPSAFKMVFSGYFSFLWMFIDFLQIQLLWQHSSYIYSFIKLGLTLHHN